MERTNDAPLMELRDAERALARVQAAGRTVSEKLCGDPVSVKALPGNAFRITSGQSGDPKGLRSYAFLEQRALLSVLGDESRYNAVVTWDTMLHHMVRTRDLRLERRTKK